MSNVYFHLQSAEASGFAVGEIWRAFAYTAFDRKTFTAYFGPDSEPVVLAMPGGDYWVQLKLPHGELTRELVNVPEQTKVVEVILRIPQATQVGTSSLSILPKFDRTALQVTGRVAHLPKAAALPGSNRRTRSVRSTVPTPIPALFALDPASDFSVRIGESGPVDAFSPTRFSLSRIHGKFLRWPRRSFSRAARATAAFIQPDDYFTWALRAPALEPMAVLVDGNSLVSELATIGNFLVERHKKDIADGRFTRDLVVVRSAGNKLQMLVVIPNGWSGGASAQLRIIENEAGISSPLRISVEVQDPRFNALLQFMRTGDLNAAVQVVESSVEMLYAKLENPFAAAAAGYILVRAAPETMRMPWQYWIGNLGRYFADLPDGEILHATVLLQRGDVQDWGNDYDLHDKYFPKGRATRNRLAAQLILSALSKGPPMYRMGLSLLASNLRILHSVELPEDTRLLLNEGEKLVTWLSMRVDPVEPFCVFRLRG